MTQPLPEFPCSLCEYPHNVEGLCGRCHNRLYAQLDDLLPLWGEAHGQLQPGRSGNGGRSNEMSIGVNVHALSFIQGADLLGFLNEWGKLIGDERELNYRDRVKGEAMGAQIDRKIKYLQTHLPWLGRTDYIGDFAGELKELHSAGTVAAKRFTDKVQRMACPSEYDDGLPCGTMLKILEDPLEEFQCRSCKSSWTVLRLMGVVLSDPNSSVWLDAEAIGQFLGLAPRSVPILAKKHKVAQRGERFNFKQFLATRGEELDKTAKI